MARASVCLSVWVSVCGSVCKAFKHDRDWTVPARTVKLGTHTTYDKRTNHIDFQGQGSKVKVTCWTLCLFVRKACKRDRDWTVPARAVKLGTHTTCDKRTNPIDFQGQGSKVKVTCWTLLLKPCKQDTDWTVSARTMKLGTHNSYDKRTTPIDFQGQGQRSWSHATHSC